MTVHVHQVTCTIVCGCRILNFDLSLSYDIHVVGCSMGGSNFHLLFCETPSELQLLVTTGLFETVQLLDFLGTVLTSTNKSNITYVISRGELVFINIRSDLTINCSNPEKHATAIRLQPQDGKDIYVVGVHIGENDSINGVLVFPKIETKSRTYEYFALSASKGHSQNQ